MKKVITFILCALFVFTLSGCGSSVQQGLVGIMTNWDGTVDPTPLTPGFHTAVFSHITEIAASEIGLDVEGMQPITKDKTKLQKLDVVVQYQVDPQDAVPIYLQYRNSNRNAVDSDGVVYLLHNYIQALVSSAASDSVSKFNALEINDHRTDVEADIRSALVSKLKEENLDGKIRISSVLVKDLEIDSQLTASNLGVIKAQNDLRAKQFEVQTAQLEAQKMKIQGDAATPSWIQYTQAQSQMVASRGIADAVASGHVPNWVIMPESFRGNVNFDNK